LDTDFFDAPEGDRSEAWVCRAGPGRMVGRAELEILTGVCSLGAGLAGVWDTRTSQTEGSRELLRVKRAATALGFTQGPRGPHLSGHRGSGLPPMRVDLRCGAAAPNASTHPAKTGSPEPNAAGPSAERDRSRDPLA
jgi:hypothetical protein